MVTLQSTFTSPPSNSYIENATISLVREYLYRKNFKATLKCLNHEEKSFEGLHNHRLALARELHLEKLVLENKRTTTTTSNKTPLHSILEVLVRGFICRRISSCDFGKKNREIFLSSPAHKTSLKDVGIQVNLKPRKDVIDEEESRFTLRETEKSSANETRLSKSTSSIPAGPNKSHSIRSPELEAVEPLSPPSTQMNFDTEFHIKSRPPHPVETQRERGAASQSPEGGLVQNILQSKRDMLADSWLTKKENKKRVLIEDPSGSTAATTPPTRDTAGDNAEEDYTLEFEDIEDEDFGFSEATNSGVRDLNLSSRNQTSSKSVIKSLDVATWRELKNAVVGKNGMIQDGWMSQGFTFDSNIPYGIVQKKGGPCGVLAVVQSLLLRNLMFGSDLCTNLKSPSKKLEDFLFGEASVNCYKSRGVNHEWILSHRGEALIGTLVEILWRCRKNQKDPVLLCLEGNQPGLPVIQIETLDDLKVVVYSNLYKFDCIGLVYSCVLTRGFKSVQEDMDFPNSPLLGQHGYCSQELINLLLFGKCISNAFDNEVQLDDKVLKGITSQSEIGLLSLFEHYGSFQVGSYLKNPIYPIWLVCSESHFSVLFSSDRSLTTENPNSTQFTLFFYDGLARLDETVRLTISIDETSQGKSSKTVQYVKKGFQNDRSNEDNLIPPLEKCIRTKWNNAVVGWNGTDPIL